MKSNKQAYLVALSNLLTELDNIIQILDGIEISGATSESEQLIDIYKQLFYSKELVNHIDFRIEYVAKSIHAFTNRSLNSDNANRHIVLNLKSKEAIWIDNVYDNRINDLLKFFKHLFSVIENYAIYQNKNKLQKFHALAIEIRNEVNTLLVISIEAEKEHPATLRELLKQEAEEAVLRSRSNKLKSNWRLYVNLIEENDIKCLYHFTDRSNIDSIISNGGLFSWKYCEQNKIYINTPGGDSLSRRLDERKGAGNYVRLSLCKNHPMLYFAKNDGRVKNEIILECNPELIYHIGTKYCDMNATRNEAKIVETFDGFKNIRFDIIKNNQQPKDVAIKKFYQAEILVFEQVPIHYINNIDDL